MLKIMTLFENLIKMTLLTITICYTIAVALFLFGSVMHVMDLQYTTTTAFNNMKLSPYYHKLHKISRKTNNKKSEVFLEQGNYCWGGYSAVLIIETKDNTKLYSYNLFRDDNGRYAPVYNEWKIDNTQYLQFMHDLTKSGLFTIKSYNHELFNHTVFDGSTYFIYAKKDDKEKKIAIYSPDCFPEANKHWNIINKIERFAAATRGSN